MFDSRILYDHGREGAMDYSEHPDGPERRVHPHQSAAFAFPNPRRIPIDVLHTLSRITVENICRHLNASSLGAR